MSNNNVDSLPAWKKPTRPEHRWPATVALLVAIVLQFILPHDLSLRPTWLLPTIEMILLIALLITNPFHIQYSKPARAFGLTLCAIITVANGISCALLVITLLTEKIQASGMVMFLSGFAIWATNIIIFSLWYWELDRGGPAQRTQGTHDEPDFLFPQMTETEPVYNHYWEPRYFDYLYTAFTNAVAFSPTDTMPLSRWAKALMMTQSFISLVTILVIVARAISILR